MHARYRMQNCLVVALGPAAACPGTRSVLGQRKVLRAKGRADELNVVVAAGHRSNCVESKAVTAL
jgi:hypothetical protein